MCSQLQPKGHVGMEAGPASANRLSGYLFRRVRVRTGGVLEEVPGCRLAGDALLGVPRAGAAPEGPGPAKSAEQGSSRRPTCLNKSTLHAREEQVQRLDSRVWGTPVSKMGLGLLFFGMPSGS